MFYTIMYHEGFKQENLGTLHFFVVASQWFYSCYSLMTMCNYVVLAITGATMIPRLYIYTACFWPYLLLSVSLLKNLVIFLMFWIFR